MNNNIYLNSQEKCVNIQTHIHLTQIDLVCPQYYHNSTTSTKQC